VTQMFTQNILRKCASYARL